MKRFIVKNIILFAIIAALLVFAMYVFKQKEIENEKQEVSCVDSKENIQTVSVTKCDETPIFEAEPISFETTLKEQEKPKMAKFTAEDLEILALIIYQEAGGDLCSDETRQMVGEVLLNRVASPLFPNTIKEVATQKGQYGRLYWTGIVWPQRHTYKGEQHAVERAYRIAESLLNEEVERLLPEDAIWQSEFKQGKEVLVFAEGIYFCR